MNVLVNEDKEVDNKILQSYKAVNDMKLPEITASKKEKFEDDQDIDQKPTDEGEEEFPTHN